MPWSPSFVLHILQEVVFKIVQVIMKDDPIDAM